MKVGKFPYRAIIYLTLVAMVTPIGLSGKYGFEKQKVEISLIPDYNHFPIKVGISTQSGKECLVRMKLQSDASWVKPSIDHETGELVLKFDTLTLFNKSYRAKITGELDGNRYQIFVVATIVGLNTHKLVEDPYQPRVYAVSPNKETLGSIVVFDPFKGMPVGSITVGNHPSDLALSRNGKELFVINSGSQTVNILDTEILITKETVELPVWGKEGASIRSSHIGIGPEKVFYYTDGAEKPVLHVYDRCHGKVIQSNLVGKLGTGDFTITSDKSKLVCWTQEGWREGLSNTKLAVLKIGEDGMLEVTEGHDPAHRELFRAAPMDTQVLLAKDEKSAIIHRYAFSLENPSAGKVLYPEEIVSLSNSGKFAISTKALYDSESGKKLAGLPTHVAQPIFFNALGRVVYFSSQNERLEILDLSKLLRPSITGLEISPKEGEVCLPPKALKWEEIPWAESYDVYLGSLEESLINANRHSPEFLGNSKDPTFALPSTLPTGKEYCWRRDVVTKIGVQKGTVHHFRASKVAVNPNALWADCLSGYKSHEIQIDLESAQPGQDWRVTTATPWIEIQSKSGQTPEALFIVFDGSELKPGIHTGSIELHVDCSSPLRLPVELTVTPLVLTQLASRLDSPMVYGITEAKSDKTPSKAILLEINSETGRIERSLDVGSSVSDLTIHHQEGRIYIPNWKNGELLAVGMEKLERVQSYQFSPFKGVGYSRSDVYKVSAGRLGRLVVEAADQWVDMCLLDTETGKVLSKTNVRQGDGVFPNPGRYYYHGDSNISNASLHKYDTVGDTFKKVKSARSSGGRNSGARTVVATKDGTKLFWNGSMFDTNLNVMWSIGDEIQSVSSDGKLAFGMKNIYNLEEKTAVMAMPPKAKPNAYNPITQKLVVQEGERIGFVKISRLAN